MKVLVISHNPIMTGESMGKTLLSLFSEFDKSEICQLYIYPSIPDVAKCNSYFRITDKEVLRSFFGKKAGREIEPSETGNVGDGLFENSKDESLYRNPKNKGPFRMLLRDVMWSASRWFSRRLKSWIENEAPTVIFVAPGSAKFLYDVAAKISSKFSIPIVTYICDDFYFTKKPKHLLKKFQDRLLKKKIESFIARTESVVSICDEIANGYSEKFGTKCHTIMTGSSFDQSQARVFFDQNKHDSNALVYLGNVRCGRFRSLSEIGQALGRINERESTNYYLKVYTAEKNENILKELSLPTIKVEGFVGGAEFIKTLCSAEVLVHAESLDENMADIVKNSISTKIADSLASGRKFLAYGPKNIASISYLKRNGLAFVATDKESLDDVVFDSLTKTGREYIANAKLFAINNHDSKKNSEKLRSILENPRG